MSSEKRIFKLHGPLEFPLSSLELSTISNQLLRYDLIEMDLTESTFNAGGIAGLLEWLNELQISSKGAVSKIIFSSRQLYSGEHDVSTMEGISDYLIAYNRFFYMIEIEIIDDEEALLQYDEVQRELYDMIKSGAIDNQQGLLSSDLMRETIRADFVHWLEDVMTHLPSNAGDSQQSSY